MYKLIVEELLQKIKHVKQYHNLDKDILRVLINNLY